MSFIRRLFVEKKPSFGLEAQHVLSELRDNLGISSLENVRIAVRYDVEGLSEQDFQVARWSVLSEPPLDQIHDETLPLAFDEQALAVEYLPGQYDQRADSAAQCLQLLSHGVRPVVACAKVYVFKGALQPGEMARIRHYLINPVDSREASAEKPATLTPTLPEPGDIRTLGGFTTLNGEALAAMAKELGLAMTLADLQHTQRYFRDEERREPTETEIRLLDTYWSDHCRHTTFLTHLTEVSVAPGAFSVPIQAAYGDYQAQRQALYADRQSEKPECLMDMALLPMRTLRKAGRLEDQEVSNEINACSLMVEIDNTAAPDGREKWLFLFKNETHNHPTEIEPFGGAATCLGGAIRDPLSGRAYVYHAMRVTGSGDPRQPLADTLPGKLPQRKITLDAASGFACYGNQIGLCTGQVVEYYDPGYVAKRMEIGAVVGAVPQAQVRREEPVPGDQVVLVGGRTGRDGIGGATGSSKTHTESSLASCGAEVQKGDPPMERKLQRLFRRSAFSLLVKKCNDFGAGGISVAIGELADGLQIELDRVPKKYEGLNGTELAIAESQERMAVVVAPDDVQAILRLAAEENLEAIPVATVLAEKRMRMMWRGRLIADLSRAFLDTNGAAQQAKAHIPAPDPVQTPFVTPPVVDLRHTWLQSLTTLQTCSQRGLGEKFDSTIGGGSVLLPYGGKYRRTPAEAMVAKFPLLQGETRSASAMSHGFFPALSRWSPFHGAVWAHVQAAARIVAVGGHIDRLRFTLQEYFGKPMDVPERWGAPAAALLGAMHAQLALECPAIGGKDSMSGTFKDLDVPPTLVAFAVDVVQANQVSSPELKGLGHEFVLVDLPRTEDELPDWTALKHIYERVGQAIRQGKVLAAKVLGLEGLAPALSIMAFGNGMGLYLSEKTPEFWFAPRPGAFVLELEPGATLEGLEPVSLGLTISEKVIRLGSLLMPLDALQQAWEAPLEGVFPTVMPEALAEKEILAPFKPIQVSARKAPALRTARPRVLITAFPGTNCEYDCARAFERMGAETETLVFCNQNPQAVEDSLDAITCAMAQSHILMLPGGFSAGDEPDGSGKFIAAAFRAPRVKDAIHDLLHRRDGLILGICNGFQALIKLGLVPYGEIRDQRLDDPTLTFNNLRYTSRMAMTRVTSNLSPWLSRLNAGDRHVVAVAHGEGRIVGPTNYLRDLLMKGQVATQYVDEQGRPTMESEYNPNGSALAIEGLTSPDGRVFGKMAHAERYMPFTWQNVPGEKDMQIFRAGVDYFK